MHKKGPVYTTGPSQVYLIGLLEAGSYASIETTTDIVEDRAAGTNAGRAERRQTVGQVVDTQVEARLFAYVDAQLHPDVENVRVIGDAEVVEVLRCTALERNTVLNCADRLLRQVTQLCVEREHAEVGTKIYLNLVLGVAELTHSGISESRDRKSTRLNSSHIQKSRMPSSA